MQVLYLKTSSILIRSKCTVNNSACEVARCEVTVVTHTRARVQGHVPQQRYRGVHRLHPHAAGKSGAQATADCAAEVVAVG